MPVHMTCRSAVTSWSGSRGAHAERDRPLRLSSRHDRAAAQRLRERDLPRHRSRPGTSILRVHRLGYHTEVEIASELAWMDALRAEAGVRTPRILPATDGRRIVTSADPSSGERRHCVRFEYLAGSEPVDHAALHFAELGEITARMHTARTAMGPAGLVHPVPLGLRRVPSARRRAGAAGRTASASARAEREVLGRLDAGCGPGSPRSAPGRSATAWSTRTRGSPT